MSRKDELTNEAGEKVRNKNSGNRFNGKKKQSARCSNAGRPTGDGRNRRCDSGVRADDRDVNNIHINDPAWYHLNDTANKAAGNLPFGMMMGQRRNVDGTVNFIAVPNSTYQSKQMQVVTPEGKAEKYFDYTPGMLLTWYTPMVGISNDSNSALNVATQGVYAWVRHANSGHTNYDPSDLMMYFCAVDSLQTLYAWMCKLYGNISRYSAVNRYFPGDWFDSLGIDFGDFQNNIPNFLAYLNVYALKLATFAVPAQFPIFKRHAMLASTMFVDADLSKDKFQIYDFNPRNIWKYTGLNTSKDRTELTLVRMPNAKTDKTHPMTFAELTEFADSLINPLISNVDDFGTMSGDVRKAYADGGLFTVNQISSDYKAELVHDALILQQIQNMDLIGEVDITRSTIYAPATDDMILSHYETIVSQTKGTLTYEWQQKSLLVDKSDPTPDDVFEISRNVAFVKPLEENGHPNRMVVTDAGTEIFENAALVYEPNSSSKFMITKYAPLIVLQNESMMSSLKPICAHMSMLSELGAFAYRPEFHIAIAEFNATAEPAGAAENCYVTPDNRDLVNWTIMSRDEFRQINGVAMMSLWDVPRLGTSF